MAERELATVLGPFDDHLAPHEIFMNASHEDSATAVAAGWPELESRWTKPRGSRSAPTLATQPLDIPRNALPRGSRLNISL